MNIGLSLYTLLIPIIQGFIITIYLFKYIKFLIRMGKKKIDIQRDNPIYYQQYKDSQFTFYLIKYIKFLILMGKKKIDIQRDNPKKKLSDLSAQRKDLIKQEENDFSKFKENYELYLEDAKNRPFKSTYSLEDADNQQKEYSSQSHESEMEEEDLSQQSKDIAPQNFSSYICESSQYSVPLQRVQLETGGQQSESETMFRNKLPFKISQYTPSIQFDSDDEYQILNIQNQKVKNLLAQRPQSQWVADSDDDMSGQEIIIRRKKVSKKKGTKKITIQKEEIIQPECNYQRCINSLQENALPEEISCRDQEKENIRQFIKQGINQNGQQQVLYLSGVPGIGKTASVLEVKEKLLKQRNNFQFVHINAMNFGVAESVYQFILEQITGIEKVNRHQACILLNELFIKGKLPSQYKQIPIHKQPTVLLVDECDNLLTSNQQVLYNLLDWPSHKQSKLIVIFIANTMDFPEKLKPKLQSRMGNNRVVFKPYTSAQIQEIITQRLKQTSSIFLNRTFDFVGKKVASVSTDIRRALQVCRIAVEIAKKSNEKVDIPHIREAYSLVYDKPFYACIRKFPKNLKLLMITIALEIHLKQTPICSLQQIIQRFKQYQQNVGDHNFLCYEELKEILIKLKLSNLVEIREQNQFKSAGYNNIQDLNIQPKFTVDDLKNALQDDELFKEFSRMF
ncbi:hypothetical protein pb186bvf_004434 [Paramecium bursaria]